MIPVILAEHALHLVAVAAVASIARHLVGPFAAVAKDLAIETIKGEAGAQVLHRSVKFASRTFHFEKHPALTLLTHFLTEENLAEASAGIITAAAAEHAVRTMSLGSLRISTWSDKTGPKTIPEVVPQAKLPFIERASQASAKQQVEVYS